MKKLYLPQPDEKTGIIPQFDGYFDLKEIDLSVYKNASVVGTVFHDYSGEDVQGMQAGKQADIVEELYNETRDKKRSERKKIITYKMLPYFRDKQATAEFVNAQFERKLRNIICRKVRLMRKVNLQTFNFFCTFTYDSAKHTEESFMRKLKGCFKMMLIM